MKNKRTLTSTKVDEKDFKPSHLLDWTTITTLEITLAINWDINKLMKLID